MKNILTTILSIVISAVVFAQSKEVVIDWRKDFTELNEELKPVIRPYFKKAFYPTPNSVPHYVIHETVKGYVTNVNIEISNSNYLPVSYTGDISEKNEIITNIKHSGNQSTLEFLIPTIKKDISGESQKLKSFNYEFNYEAINKKQNKSLSFRSSTNSPMASGDWYKIGVTSTGIQKISKSFFSNNGISTSDVDPRNIRVFGYSEGMLSESIISNTPKTMPEIPIYFEGESDGEFGSNDYFLFFAKGADVWEWNHSNKYFYHEKHLYTDTIFYWINFGTENGKRISNQPQTREAANQSYTTYENHQFHELENTNLIQTGRNWYGDYFDIAAGLKKSFYFNFPNKTTGEKVHLKAKLATRSTERNSNSFIFKHNNSIIHQTENIPPISSYYTENYVVEETVEKSYDITGTSSNLEITYNYPTSGAVAWLDYIEVKTDCDLTFNESPLIFSQPLSVGSGNVSTFIIKGTTSETRIWDITSPYETFEIDADFSSNQTSFKVKTDSIRSFVAFKSSGFKTPFYAGKAQNQNLMSLTDKDYIIITLPQYLNQAIELAQFHKEKSNLSTQVVTLQMVYNEFSNGHADIAAIRNFMRYLYENASSEDSRIKYLMLFGDASYDPKNRISSSSEHIPSFQSNNSISPTASFVSDDYFAMLDDANGIYSSSSQVDIAIGRFPARNSTDAEAFVAKVKHYVNSQLMKSYDGQTGSDLKSTFEDWKNKMLFVADDGSLSDGYTNIHAYDAESVIDAILDVDSSFNISKVYLDSYNKQSTAGGGRYPDVNREIREAMNEGVFFVNYTGHGGEGGWADEKILTVSDINSWTNIDALPVFVTATCEFSRFDNPDRVSGGEYVILNPNGGAIAMITTTRLVYRGGDNNTGFSENFFEAALSKQNGNFPTLGDAMMQAKINSPLGINSNNRKFALLGDPALKMSYPKYDVVTTQINDITLPGIDTLKALTKVKVEGEIKYNGQQANINGFIYPIVYDKLESITTLDNNKTSNTLTYDHRHSIIYQGIATVENGKFSFEFIVTKDINYSFGNGRISYYFANDTVDGKGYTEQLVVGGSSNAALNDNEDPVIELFMNDTNFIFGGLTDESPTIYALISDDNGINTSGNSLGHDITAVLDEDYSNSIILNDYYSATLNDYKSGKILYLLNELSDGTHTLSLKAWDVNNNSGKAYTEFIVANNAKLAINHVYNYPNPFTTNTTFLFEHNQMNEDLDVMIKIFTISGKVIKTIETNINSMGNNKSKPIDWDGLDDFGDKIGRGVYVYQIEVKSSAGETARKIEKLVILR